MIGLIIALAFLAVTLYGYFLAVRPSKLESEIRKNKLPYQCFECKAEFSVNERKCPECSFETLYGKEGQNTCLLFQF